MMQSRATEKTNALIRKTQLAGYGNRYREIIHETGSIAVPIFSGNRVTACVGIAFFASALTPRDAAARLF